MTEAQTTTTTGEAAGGDKSAASAPMAATSAVQTKAPDPSDTAKPSNAASIKTRLEAGDEIPEGAELLELSPRALTARLDRYTKKQLREKFGTEDFDDIKGKLDRLAKFEADEETRKRAEMTELEKHKADTARLRSERDEAKRSYKAMQEQHIVEKEDARISKIAGKYIDADYVEDTLPKLARHLQENFTEAQLEKLKDSDIEKFFEDLAKAKPKLSKDYDTAKAAEKAPAKAPLTNGAKAPEKSPSTGVEEQKSFKPGGQNSMSPQDARAAARRLGYSW